MDASSCRPHVNPQEAASFDFAVVKSEQGRESSDDVANKVRELMKRHQERATLENLRLVDRYDKEEIHLLVYILACPELNQFVAEFRRYQTTGAESNADVPNVLHYGAQLLALDSLVFKLPLELRGDVVAVVNGVIGRCNGQKDAMLVDDVKLVQHPKIVPLPTLIRLDRVDGTERCSARSLYFSVSRGLILLGASEDREIDSVRPRRYAPMPLDAKRKGDVIERAPKALNCFASNGGNLIGDRDDVRDAIECASRIRVVLESDSAWLGSIEGSERRVEILDVLFGPFDF